MKRTLITTIILAFWGTSAFAYNDVEPIVKQYDALQEFQEDHQTHLKHDVKKDKFRDKSISRKNIETDVNKEVDIKDVVD